MTATIATRVSGHPWEKLNTRLLNQLDEVLVRAMSVNARTPVTRNVLYALHRRMIKNASRRTIVAFIAKEHDTI